MSARNLHDVLQSAIGKSDSAYRRFRNNTRRLHQEQKKQADLEKSIEEHRKAVSSKQTELESVEEKLANLKKEQDRCQQEKANLRELVKRNEEQLKRCEDESKTQSAQMKIEESGLKRRLELLNDKKRQLANTKLEAERIATEISQFDIQRWIKEKPLRQTVRNALQKALEDSLEHIASSEAQERPKKVCRTDASNSMADDEDQPTVLFVKESARPGELSVETNTYPVTPLRQVVEEQQHSAFENEGTESAFSGDVASTESTHTLRVKPDSQFLVRQHVIAPQATAQAHTGATRTSLASATQTQSCAKQQITACSGNIPGRNEANSADLPQKLEILLALEKQCGPATSLVPFNSPEQHWVRSTMRPMLNCFRNHHNSNKDCFFAAWEDNFNTEFSRLCCKGDPGEPCSSLNIVRTDTPKPAGVSFKKGPPKLTWDQAYGTFSMYHEAYGGRVAYMVQPGCLNLLATHLRQWIQDNRSRKRQGLLSQEQVIKLNALSFDWEEPPCKTKRK